MHIKHHITGSHIITPKYFNDGIKNITNNIFPHNSIMLETSGTTFFPIP